jgi:hypothetical protein
MSEARILSGLYTSAVEADYPLRGFSWPDAGNMGAFDWLQPVRVELRLDVDGPDALQVASGRFVLPSGQICYWLAGLRPTRLLSELTAWRGAITCCHGFYRLLISRELDITLLGDGSDGSKIAVLTMNLSMAGEKSFLLVKRTPHFRHVEVQVDFDKADQLVPLSIDPYIIPGNHPPEEELGLPHSFKLEDAYDLAGIQMTVKASEEAISLATQDMAQIGQAQRDTWDRSELHCLMESVWRPHGHEFRDAPEWAAWLFFAEKYERIRNFGIMFDYGGGGLGRDRQGAAVFQEAFSTQLPNFSSDGLAWIRRHKFFTTVHELGHTFNLYHPGSKQEDDPWPFVDPDLVAKSFMCDFLTGENDIESQEKEFFADFKYRFRRDELLFLRHAPEPFVQMGNAALGQDHGHALPAAATDGPYTLSLETGGDHAVYEFLEPVHLDVILANVSADSLTIDPATLDGGRALEVLVRRPGGLVRSWRPHYRAWGLPVRLARGQVARGSILVSSGRDGWLIDEPGIYTIQASLLVDGLRISSAPLSLRVLRPRHEEQDRFAQRYFQPSVGLLLSLEGSRASYLESANKTMEELAQAPALKDTLAAQYARYLRHRVLARPFKAVEVDGRHDSWRTSLAARRLRVLAARPGEARSGLERIFGDPRSRQLFGRVEYARRALWYARWLDEGHAAAAASAAGGE